MIYVIIKKPSFLSRPFLFKALRFAFSSLKKRNIPAPAKKLTVAFVSKREIQALNFQFRKKKQPTDILSFAPVEEESLGELALFCDPQRAADRGLTTEEEVFYLLLHGILHLLGYTHEKGGSTARRMFQLQDDIFNEWPGRKNKTSTVL